MPFRERLKKTFSRSSSDGLSLSQTNTNGSRKDSSVYQPGEKMPPLKYRRPVAKEHKEHLEAFNFAKAWRRRSHQSIYSPMGSRMPSRAGSVVTNGPSRNGSVITTGRKSFHANRGPSVELAPTGEAPDEESSPRNGEADDSSSSTSPASSSAASQLTLDVVERMESWSFAR